MFKIKIFISISTFIILLIITSIIKNQTREIEKKIFKINDTINFKERDLSETQFDFAYLTSPSMIQKKIEYLDIQQYSPLDYSKIFLNISSFLDIQNKFAIINENEKKTQKK